MTVQPNTQPEQTTDPNVIARLMASCDTTVVLPVATLRQRLIRASRTARRACRVR